MPSSNKTDKICRIPENSCPTLPAICRPKSCSASFPFPDRISEKSCSRLKSAKNSEEKHRFNCSHQLCEIQLFQIMLCIPRFHPLPSCKSCNRFRQRKENRHSGKQNSDFSKQLHLGCNRTVTAVFTDSGNQLADPRNSDHLKQKCQITLPAGKLLP